MNRSVAIDTIKAVGSQVIVLHHFSQYAPMTDWLVLAWPRLVGLIYEEGRLAVQPFLVVGGFLTAQSLGQQARSAIAPLILKRYLRLAPQLAVSLLLVVFATFLLGHELDHEEWLSPLPSIGVFLAHLFFLQDVLGIEAMSAGAWYVAIDLQLFGLFVILARVSRLLERPLSETYAPILIACATVASIHIFSKSGVLDIWGIYYLSAYGLGALVSWSHESSRARKWFWITSVLLVVDWIADPRARPILALATALCLYGFSQFRWSSTKTRMARVIRYFSDVSYSTFVSHFAVIVVVSGIWERYDLQGHNTALAFLVLAWIASLLVGNAVQTVCDQSLRIIQSGK
jgi:peptidoglycan/LPS O-acetylase OafA/YrhL